MLQNDVVIVDAAGSVLLSASNHQTLDLLEGNMQFLTAPTMVQVVNNGPVPAKVIAIELLKRWNVPMKPCAPPLICARDITVGGMKIGESATFFTNGYVTAQWNGMNPGGSLDSTYFSPKGKDYMVFIALTDLDGNFGGKKQHLAAGSVFATEAKEVEIDAGKDEARWCVLRINDKK